MSQPVIRPGSRDLRGSINRVTAQGSHSTPEGGTHTVIIACPPHPLYGGSRHDKRLQIVSDAALRQGIDCFRFDYGPWQGGYEAVEDARTAVQWADNRYEHIVLFGYSFGGAIALLAASNPPCDVHGVSVLAPVAQVTDNVAVVPALSNIRTPIQVICGRTDTTVDWEPIAEKVDQLGCDVVRLSTDHSFIGYHDQVADTTTQFFDDVVDTCK